MRTAHLCCGLGGSLWTGAILGWESVYALDSDGWRINRIWEQIRAGWWPGLRADCALMPQGIPARLDGGVDLIAAGFSCRDISSAGKGAGLGGSSTGPTYAGCMRAIDAWRPRLVFFENSPQIKTRGRGQVLRDLRDRGYGYQDGTLSAAEVGAPHKRDRWFLLAERADLAGERWPERRTERSGSERGFEDPGMGGPKTSPYLDGVRQLEPAGILPDIGGRDSDGATQTPDADRLGRPRRSREQRAGWGLEPADGDPTPADLMRDGLQITVQCGGISESAASTVEAAAGYCGAHHWNPPMRDVCRVVDGLADRKHRGDKGRRIEALGDAWVPLQAAAAWKILGGP